MRHDDPLDRTLGELETIAARLAAGQVPPSHIADEAARARQLVEAGRAGLRRAEQAVVALEESLG